MFSDNNLLLAQAEIGVECLGTLVETFSTNIRTSREEMKLYPTLEQYHFCAFPLSIPYISRTIIADHIPLKHLTGSVSVYHGY